MSDVSPCSSSIQMRLRDLEHTVTRLQNLPDDMIATRIPHWRNPSDVEAAKQRRADGVELRELLMPLASIHISVFNKLLDEWSGGDVGSGS